MKGAKMKKVLIQGFIEIDYIVTRDDGLIYVSKITSKKKPIGNILVGKFEGNDSKWGQG
jgi:hypothetical protein